MAWLPGYFYLAPMICPGDGGAGEDLAPRIFYKKFINCLLNHCEICRFDISKQKKNKYKKKCSKQKQLLEIREVGKKNLWKALTP